MPFLRVTCVTSIDSTAQARGIGRSSPASDCLMLSRLCFTSSDVLIRCNACTVLLVNKRLHATLLSLSLHPRLHCFGLTSVGFGDYERGRGKSGEGGGWSVVGLFFFLSLLSVIHLF
jgi:hypothetical protein